MKGKPISARNSTRSASISVPSTSAQPDAEDRYLGRRLKSLRREQKLSLQMLAERSSVSIGMLSQIERGLSTPSVRSLRLLAVALSIPISWFFAPAKYEHELEARYVVRRGERRLLKLNPNGVMKELLSPRASDLVELYELTLEPDCSSGDDFINHEGEKAGMVISGSLRLWIDEMPYLLKAGDSFQFPSMLPHRFDNPSGASSRVVWVVAPAIGRPARQRKAPKQE